MAIAFARVSIHSRSKGHSAVAAASYRSGGKLYDERTGLVHDYSKKNKEVVYASIMLPSGADLKFQDRQALWNAVEAAEKRINSQVCKDHILALPKEVARPNQIELARQFAQDHFVRHGLVADIAIHDHGDGNPHAHILTSTRRLVGGRFGDKARDLNPGFAKGFITSNDDWGKVWADFQEDYFEKNNLEITVDGLNILPQMHRGAQPNSRYIEQENQERKRNSVSIALNDPASVVNILSSKKAVFNDKDLAKLLFKNTDTPEQFQQAYQKTIASDLLLDLGLDDAGNTIFATKGQLALELKMQSDAEKMARNSSFKVKGSIPKKLKGLNAGQKNAIEHLSKGNQLSVLVGQAGTGKSFLMDRARHMWEESGYKVLGISVSGKASIELQQSSGIQSRSLASLKTWLENTDDVRTILTPKHVLVMDEAGMTNAQDMAFFLDIARKTGCGLVLVGDAQQLQPIGAGAPLRAIQSIAGHAILDEVLRQDAKEDREASQLLAKGDVASGIDHYQKKGAISLVDIKSMLPFLIDEWADGLSQETLDQRVIFGCDGELNQINTEARAHAQKFGLIGKKEVVFKSKGLAFKQNAASLSGWANVEAKVFDIAISEGDRIIVRDGESCSGHLGTVASIGDDSIHYKPDENDSQTLEIKPSEMPYFDHAYAVNLSKVSSAVPENLYNCMCLSTVHSWSENILEIDDLKKNLMLAQRNVDVMTLNRFARERLVNKGLISLVGSQFFKGFDGETMNIAVGDRLILRKNDKSMAVSNGDFGTVISMDKKIIKFELDSGEKIGIDTEIYQGFSYAYATTVHKAQGASIKNIFICANGMWDRFLAYVALTRHKSKTHITASFQQYGKIKTLSDRWSDAESKDNTLDYPINYGRRRGLDPEKIMKKFKKRWSEEKKPQRIDWEALKSIKNSKVQRVCLNKSRIDHSLKGVGYLKAELEFSLISLVEDEKSAATIREKSPETFQAILQDKKRHEQEWGGDSSKCRDRIDWGSLSRLNHPLINTICELDKKIKTGGLSKKHGDILMQQLEKTISNATRVDSLMEQLKEKAPETQRAFYVLAAQRATRSHEHER